MFKQERAVDANNNKRRDDFRIIQESTRLLREINMKRVTK